MNKTMMVLAMSLVLAGCAEGQNNQKETLGTIIGAGLGALVGEKIGDGSGRTAAIVVGSIAGAYFGGQIGKSLDEADRAHMSTATQSALERNPSGATSTWRNPDSGNSGTITPVRTFATAGMQNCREYKTTVKAAGQVEQGLGTACRDADGTWRIQN